MKFEKFFLMITLLTPTLSLAKNLYQNLLDTPSQYDKGLILYSNTSPLITSKIGYIIKASNVTFDCHGQTLDGKGIARTGLLIESYGQNISNIVIKNCTFQNFKYNGIRIGWGIPDKLKTSIPVKERYKFHPSNVIIDNVKIINSGSIGLYIDDYSNQITLKNSEILNSGASAIYLEFSSKNNIIDYNLFSNNGLTKNRETIAIDSSFNNKITNNTFEKNKKGGIFLYKNCQEHVSTGNSVIRKFGANNNIISNNLFKDEKIGIWIASRQSLDLSKWDCGDKSMYENKYYQDFSNYNIISNNIFKSVDKAIIIEGDYNQVHNNSFDNNVRTPITIPKTAREKYLKIPPTGNNVE